MPDQSSKPTRLDADRDTGEPGIIRLAPDDQVRFARDLIDPPPPKARLVRAARRHADLIKPR